MSLIRVLYKPLGPLLGVAGGLVAGRLSGHLWKLVSGDDEPPAANRKDRGWGEVLFAATLQGAVFGLVKAAVDRGGATLFDKVTGEWPGDTGDDDKS
ncbi:DUF4235 domain-containing protein [Actinosynnema sp. NPDC047251]|uniref:Uncharacterized protein n=1 Tax=Saccharothrix espanaensis (strain ATCC 51144 / DSM 44229 / JCM 9112 / NBRC 15066 / NRRL 15764) TaxID=1179773 RepID=K0K2D7_SACES|nr:DUF4235 domain-containing protein [Saccharothrix espanaensis]CCH31737.1 hypothetical protein BN6_44560 [Saccharothrix espanaensis DSM 44229]